MGERWETSSLLRCMSLVMGTLLPYYLDQGAKGGWQRFVAALEQVVARID
jgi:hypothetical protein